MFRPPCLLVSRVLTREYVRDLEQEVHASVYRVEYAARSPRWPCVCIRVGARDAGRGRCNERIEHANSAHRFALDAGPGTRCVRRRLAVWEPGSAMRGRFECSAWTQRLTGCGRARMCVRKSPQVLHVGTPAARILLVNPWKHSWRRIPKLFCPSLRLLESELGMHTASCSVMTVCVPRHACLCTVLAYHEVSQAASHSEGRSARLVHILLSDSMPLCPNGQRCVCALRHSIRSAQTC